PARRPLRRKWGAGAAPQTPRPPERVGHAWGREATRSAEWLSKRAASRFLPSGADAPAHLLDARLASSRELAAPGRRAAHERPRRAAQREEGAQPQPLHAEDRHRHDRDVGTTDGQVPDAGLHVVGGRATDGAGREEEDGRAPLLAEELVAAAHRAL